MGVKNVMDERTDEQGVSRSRIDKYSVQEQGTVGTGDENIVHSPGEDYGLGIKVRKIVV